MWSPLSAIHLFLFLRTRPAFHSPLRPASLLASLPQTNSVSHPIYSAPGSLLIHLLQLSSPGGVPATLRLGPHRGQVASPAVRESGVGASGALRKAAALCEMLVCHLSPHDNLRGVDSQASPP